MSQPGNKESKEWRDWYVRHEILGSGNAELIKIAFREGKNLEILKRFIDDILQTKN